MRSLSALLLFFATLTVSAAEPWFPDRYQQSSCSPGNICTSFETSRLSSAAARYLGLALSDQWVANHDKQMREALAPMCKKIGACFATPGTIASFCTDVVVVEMRASCGKLFTKGTNDYDQCGAYVEIFSGGVDQYARPKWFEAQACLAEKAPPVRKTTPVVWRMEPATIPHGYTGDILVFAYDPETNIPVRGRIVVEDTILWSRANPEGVPGTFYLWKWPIKYRRVPNAAGHTDLVAPMVTMTFDYYPDVTFRMPIEAPKMVVEMQPAQLRRGKNKVTIKAHDAKTGAPVEARVMMKDRVLGDTNIPFELELKKGAKRGEIWVTSLFDAYSDVVVLPGEK